MVDFCCHRIVWLVIMLILFLVIFWDGSLGRDNLGEIIDNKVNAPYPVLTKNNAALCGRQIEGNLISFQRPFSGSSISAVYRTTEAALRHRTELLILHVLAVLLKGNGNIHRVSARLPSLSLQCCMRSHLLLPRWPYRSGTSCFFPL